jgi:hypothetical protein
VIVVLNLGRWAWLRRFMGRVRLGLFFYVGLILALAAIELLARAANWEF